jgi:hypothetical protein
MKYLTLIILLFSINGYGQKQSLIVDSIGWGKSQPITLGYGLVFPSPKLDTVRVVIQYSDTTGYVDYWFEPNGKYDSVSGLIFGKEMSKKILNNHWPIYGGYAYSVREAVECPENIGSTNLVMHMFRHVEYFNRGYLDENKKPLGKNIIVWQEKEVK